MGLSRVAPLLVLLSVGACRARLPVDRPPPHADAALRAPAATGSGPAAPVALERRRVEYYQISDG